MSFPSRGDDDDQQPRKPARRRGGPDLDEAPPALGRFPTRGPPSPPAPNKAPLERFANQERPPTTDSVEQPSSQRHHAMRPRTTSDDSSGELARLQAEQRNAARPSSLTPQRASSSSSRRRERERNKALAHAVEEAPLAGAPSSRNKFSTKNPSGGPISKAPDGDDDDDDAMNNIKSQLEKNDGCPTLRRSSRRSSNNKDSKQKDDELQYLKERRLNTLNNHSDRIKERKDLGASHVEDELDILKERRQNSIRQQVVVPPSPPQPGAFRIGDNVSLEDQADLAEWRANRRAMHEEEHRQLSDSQRDSQPDRLQLSHQGSMDSGVMTVPVSLAGGTAASSLMPPDDDDKRWNIRRLKKWHIVAGILVVLAIVIGVSVGVSLIKKNNSSKNIEAATTSPSTSPETEQPSITGATSPPSTSPSASVVPTISGELWIEMAELVGAAEQDGLGVSVTLSGDGATFATSTINNNGDWSASVITIATLGADGTWDRRAQDLFMEARSAVDISQDGTVLLVTVVVETDLPRAAVYVLDETSGRYVQRGQNLTGSNARTYAKATGISDDGNRIAVSDPPLRTVTIYDWVIDSWVGTEIKGNDGHAIALSGDGSTIAISSIVSGYTHPSNITVYRFDDNEQQWRTLGQVLNAADAFLIEASSPLSLSRDGTILAVGSLSVNSGLVQVFSIVDSDGLLLWKRQGSGIIGEEMNDNLGWSVDLSADGSVVAIGLPRLLTQGSAGFVRVYHFVAGEWNVLGQEIEDLDDSGRDSVLGWDLSLSDDGRRLAVGDPQAMGENGVNLTGRVQMFDLL